MTEYKLVPFEPTPEMVSAAEDAYMPFGDMDLALRLAILAAPVVKAEQAVVPTGFRVMKPTSSVVRDGERWEIYAPCGSGGIVHEDEVTDWVVRKLLDALATAPQPAEQQPFEWPLLDAPALIGGVVVGKGCSTGTVVAIAKRKHQYEVETSPEEHARREKAFKDVLAQIHEGINQSGPEQMPGENAPDVAGLAEALERVMYCNEFGFLPESVQQSVSDALAVHRSQGGGQA